MPFRRWQVGAVRITQLVELTNVRPPNFVFRNLDQEEVLRQTWLRPHFATSDGKLISLTQSFILEYDGQRIIVDTCIGNDKDRKNPAWNKLSLPFLEQLCEAGFSPQDIDVVLCTHLHVDHVGWNTRLVGDRWMPTFPNAAYFFGRTEWEHWSRHDNPELEGDMPPEVAVNVMEARRVYDDSVRPIVEAGLHRLVDPDHRINDAVSLTPTPGHTPGHVSVCISSQGQEAIITGDLIHHPIQCADPGIASNFDYDVAQARATREQFLARYADCSTLVIGTHFAEPTAGRISRHGSTWRFSSEEMTQADDRLESSV